MSLAAASKLQRPPLKWAGGKRWQVPHLRPLWERHARRRLVEPFCGGLGVALSLGPAIALLNDTNTHLVSFYRWLQKGLRTSIRMENDETLFYEHRDRFNELLRTGGAETAEAAALFYYLNRTGFNGLCRFNRKGEFNVPFGKYERIRYVSDFSKYRGTFTAWQFLRGDIADVPIDPGDFVYADPPYDVEFTQYSQGGFSWDDQVRTATLLARHGGPVVLVNQRTPRVEELYMGLGYRLRFLNGPRRISCTGDRAPAREIMATRNV